MRISEILRSSLATLKMNGRRTFLTMLGIIIGIAAVITIISLGNGFKQQTLDSLARDEQGRRSQEFYYQLESFDEQTDPSKIQPFSAENIDFIESLPGVDEAEQRGEEINDSYMQVRVGPKEDGYPVGFTQATQLKMIAGRNLTEMDHQARKPYAIVSEMVAYTLFPNSDAIHKAINLDNQTYTIVGVFQEEMPPEGLGDSFGNFIGFSTPIFIPKGAYQRYSSSSGFNYIMRVYYQDDADMKTINRRIKEYLDENGKGKDTGSYTYFDSTEMMDEIGKQLTMITYFISAIAAISLFIAGVGVMNMMYISVSERTKEIGIRRALGATKRSIQTQFLLEGITITTLGGLVGYLLGFILALSIGQFLPFKAAFDVPTALFSVIVAMGIGIVFSVFPARQAANKNVVEILR